MVPPRYTSCNASATSDGEPLELELPVQDDRGDVRDVEHLVGELLDDENRDVFRRDALHDVVELGDDERCEPMDSSSSMTDLRVGADRRTDREHLLLATGQRARHLLAALLQPRERSTRGLRRSTRHPAVGHRAQVLEHREVGEDAAALGDGAQADHTPGDRRARPLMRSPRYRTSPLVGLTDRWPP